MDFILSTVLTKSIQNSLNKIEYINHSIKLEREIHTRNNL